MCTSCGQKMTPIVPPEDYQALVNQGVKPEDININLDDTDESDTSSNNLSLTTEFVFPDETTTAKLMAVNSASKNLKRHHSSNSSTGSSSASSSGNQSQGNSNVASTSSDLTMVNIDNANGKRSTVLASTSTSTNSNDLNLDITRNGNNQSVTAGSSGWFTIGGGVGNNNNISNNTGTTGYPASLFYGTADKAGTSAGEMATVAPLPADDNAIAAEDGGANQQAATTDVTSLSLVASNETKKARRVQKGSRCHNVSSSKRK